MKPSRVASMEYDARDIAGENEYQAIARAETIVGVNRPAQIGIEKRRVLTERREAEDDEAAVCYALMRALSAGESFAFRESSRATAGSSGCLGGSGVLCGSARIKCRPHTVESAHCCTAEFPHRLYPRFPAG